MVGKNQECVLDSGYTDPMMMFNEFKLQESERVEEKNRRGRKKG